MAMNASERGLPTRRGFGRFAALLTAGASLPLYNEFALAQLSMVRGLRPGAVKLNANENPLGPCPEAAEAIRGIIRDGGRYRYEETEVFERTLADQEGVRPHYVRAYAGSSLPLHHAVLAFTSPTRSFVVSDPGYEAGERAADFLDAPVKKIPLRADYSHDLRAMAAVPDAGLIYVCNPNNPTGTITPRSEIEWLVAHKPKDAVVMIDEAYMHIAGCQPNTDLVAADKDVIVLRTFSKIYGMAGIRAGAAIARPDLLEKMSGFTMGALPTTAMVAATASLKVKNLVPERRKTIAAVRDDVFNFMQQHRFKYVPSVSNKFMADTGRPGRDVIDAMAQENVYIGRVWPVWPTYVRVTIGTSEEMAKFKAAYLKVMA